MHDILPTNTNKHIVIMKTKSVFLSLLMCCFFSLAALAQTRSVSKEEALEIAQRQFQGKDVDYFIRQDSSQTSWNIFVDAEPMKGWEHECYTLTIPKNTGTLVYASVPLIKLPRKLPPTGNYVPLSVKNRYGTNANSKPSVTKMALYANAPTNSMITITSLLDGNINFSHNVSEGCKDIILKTGNLPKGVYIVSYYINSEIIDQVKVKI